MAIGLLVLNPLALAWAQPHTESAPPGDGSPLQLLSLESVGGSFTPVLRTNFAAVIDNHTAIPPDTCGAVGPEHVLTILNSEVAVHTRQGVLLAKSPLGSFWSAIGHSNAFDPRVAFDPRLNRFVAVAAANRSQPNSALLLAVSQGIDPTLEWDLYAIDCDAKNLLWGDYPILGLGPKWVVVTMNMISVQSNAFVRSDIFAIDQAKLGKGQNLQLQRFEETNVFTIHPATIHDAAAQDHHLVTESGTRNLRLSRLTGNPGQVVYTPQVALTPAVPAWIFSTASATAPGGTNSSPQAGTNERIFANDSRIQSVVQRLNTLWCTHQVFFTNSSGSIRSSIQWWQLTLSGEILQRGLIDDPSGFVQFTFPSLAVNRNSDVLLGYSRFTPVDFPSAYFSFRLRTDPAGTLRESQTLKLGRAPYAKLNARGRNSWGDYSATVVDPLNDMDMWTIQEYAELPDATGSRWGTWWGWIGFQASAPPVFISQPSSRAIETFGAKVQLEAQTAGTEPISYQWFFQGESLPAATNASLEIPAFTGNSVGVYYARASNSVGYARSTNFTLSIEPPSILSHPKNTAVAKGASAEFTVTVEGAKPLEFLWFKEALPLLGETNQSLRIPTADLDHAGNYSVEISNPLGSIKSLAAALTISTMAPPVLGSTSLTTNGGFRMTVSVPPSPDHPTGTGAILQLQASTNLALWSTIFTFTNSAANTSLILPLNPNVPTRYFRIFQTF